MAMGSFNSPGSQMPTAEINMTPLVDVMLVLLIIFIITAPLMTHSVKAASTPTPEKPMTLQVSITGENLVYVGNDTVDRNGLEQKFREAVAQDANVEMHLKADRNTRYETVAETMSAARRAGLTKIGFVTQPGEGQP